MKWGEFWEYELHFKKILEKLKGKKYSGKYLFGLDVWLAFAKISDSLLESNEEGRRILTIVMETFELSFLSL